MMLNCGLPVIKMELIEGELLDVFLVASFVILVLLDVLDGLNTIVLTVKWLLGFSVM